MSSWVLALTIIVPIVAAGLISLFFYLRGRKAQEPDKQETKRSIAEVKEFISRGAIYENGLAQPPG